MQLWAKSADEDQLVFEYSWTANSGEIGPKLKEGDKQIPEGIYKLIGLNPNSAYHLSIKIDYPNEFDRKMASIDGRINLGGDIFVHGKSSSIGCIAIGDRAIEELFVIAAEVGITKGKIIISPTKRDNISSLKSSNTLWVPSLYETIYYFLEPYGR